MGADRNRHPRRRCLAQVAMHWNGPHACTRWRRPGRSRDRLHHVAAHRPGRARRVWYGTTVCGRARVACRPTHGQQSGSAACGTGPHWPRTRSSGWAMQVWYGTTVAACAHRASPARPACYDEPSRVWYGTTPPAGNIQAASLSPQKQSARCAVRNPTHRALQASRTGRGRLKASTASSAAPPRRPRPPAGESPPPGRRRAFA